jgi:hypothetical protein
MGVWKADEEQKVTTIKKQPTRDSIEATLSAVWRLLKSFSVQVIVRFLLSKGREKYVIDKDWNQCKLRKCIRPSILHRYSKRKGQEAPTFTPTEPDFLVGGFKVSSLFRARTIEVGSDKVVSCKLLLIPVALGVRG